MRTSGPTGPSEQTGAGGEASRPLAVIECPQRIPCNPCEAACPFGAIHVGPDINALPTVDPSKCNGCGQCVRLCPGLAIFLVQPDASPGLAAVTVPFELPRLPNAGEVVQALGRDGRAVCDATISAVRSGHTADQTSLVTLTVPTQFAQTARAFRRIDR